jgi:hypothetical protein
LEISPELGIVIPIPVIPQSRLGIEILPGEANVQTTNCISNYRAPIKCRVLGTPNDVARRISQGFRPPHLVVVAGVKLAVACNAQ